MNLIESFGQQAETAVGIVREEVLRRFHLCQRDVLEHLVHLDQRELIDAFGRNRIRSGRLALGRRGDGEAFIGYGLVQLEPQIDILHLVGEVRQRYVEISSRVEDIKEDLGRQNLLDGRYRDHDILRKAS